MAGLAIRVESQVKYSFYISRESLSLVVKYEKQ